jgi:hypothetical protein
MARRRGQATVRTMVGVACLLLATACGAPQEVGGSAQDVVSEDSPVAATTPAERDAASPPSDDAATRHVDDDLANAADDDRPVERSLRPVVEEAVRDLSERAGVPPDQISVVLAQRVTWPDDALGCPVHGGGGLGDPHQGTRVHLEIDDELYRYHTGGTEEEPFLCDPAAARSEERSDRIEP